MSTDRHYPYDMIKELVDKAYGLEEYDIVTVWMNEDYGCKEKHKNKSIYKRVRIDKKKKQKHP